MAELTADGAVLPAGAEKAAARNRLSPGQLVKILRRDWPLLVFCGLLAGAGAYVASKTLITPRYTAQATLAVETRSFMIPELQGVLGSEQMADPMPVVRSEAQILQSRALVRSVVQDLDLTAYPEFNGALRGPTFKEQVGGFLRDHLPASVADPMVDSGVLPPANPGKPSPDVVLDGAVGTVQHDIGIANDGRSLIINVEFTSEQPDLSASVANHLVQRFLDAKQQMRTSANKEANQALEKRITEVHDEIDQLERRILDTRQKYNLVQVRAGSVGQQQVEDLSAALTRASADRAQLEANYQRAAVLAHTGAPGTDGSDALNSGIVGTLRDREATAERRVAELRTTLGPGHPSVMAAEAELASARGAVMTEAKRVMAGLGAQAQAAKARETDLRNQLAQSQTVASTQSSVQAELQQLEKDADARRALYQTLIQRAEQTQAMKEGPEQNGARVVSLAVPPTNPSSPRPKLAAGLGLLSGVAFGGLISVGLRRRERNYATAAEVEADTGLPVVGVLPRAKRGRTSLASRVVKEPTGVEAEALRSLRVRLRFGSNGAVPRSVLFVAAGEDTSGADIAAAFARVAALDGLRVLLIEGDLQSPSVAGKLGVTPANGLIKTLTGLEHWSENLSRDSAAPMDLLLAGTPQPAASRLLETMQLQSFMAEAREEYNLVVVDGHPMTEAMHSLAFVPIVDATVLVVEAGETGREELHV
ncbi:MAG: hypothetical protein JOZ42_10460, partial [Acetobacteraceae bacterium]|nr:hypothetical protein [Acetobacteraceae bacterium]